MTKWYPRNYLVVKDGAIEKLTVRDAPHEAAVILNHPEATGTNRPEAFDNSRFVIPEKSTGEE